MKPTGDVGSNSYCTSCLAVQVLDEHRYFPRDIVVLQNSKHSNVPDPIECLFEIDEHIDQFAILCFDVTFGQLSPHKYLFDCATSRSETCLFFGYICFNVGFQASPNDFK